MSSENPNREANEPSLSRFFSPMYHPMRSGLSRKGLEMVYDKAPFLTIHDLVKTYYNSFIVS